MSIKFVSQTTDKCHRVLRNEFKELFPTKQLTKKSFMEGKIKVQGKKVAEQKRVVKGTVITIETTLEDIKKWRAKIDLPVLFETKEYGIVWKEPGLMVQGRHGTSVELAAAYALKSEDCICIRPLSKSSMGLVMVAKTESSAKKLQQLWDNKEIIETWRVICQAPKEGLLDPEQFKIVSRTNSKHAQAGVLWTLDCKVEPGLDIRKVLFDLNAPIVGNSKRTVPIQSAKGRGNFEALIGFEFKDPFNGKQVKVFGKEPVKFEPLRARELVGWNQLENDPTIVYHDEQKLKGSKSFLDMDIDFDADTLIPRQSSETVVKKALQYNQERKVKVLDMGTGTGALLLLFLKRCPGSTGIGIDISKQAITMAQHNAKKHNLDHRCTFLPLSFEQIDEIEEDIDIVLCNPPYLTPSQKQSNAMSMKNDPDVAIVAGETGYEAYTVIANALANSPRIKPRSRVFIEVGHGMAKKVTEIFDKQFIPQEVVKDPFGYDRCCIFQKRAPPKV